jgi:hypothetical protein
VSLYKLKGPQGKKEVKSGKNENKVLQERLVIEYGRADESSK